MPDALSHARPRQVVIEGFALARRELRFSVPVALVAALVVALVLTVTGRAVATEHQVVATIESLGARLLVLTDSDRSAAISGSSVELVEGLDGVEWAFGLGAASAATSADGRPGVSSRAVVGDLPSDEVTLLDGRLPAQPREVLVGAGAATRLGLGDAAGPVMIGDDAFGVVGVLSATGALAFLSDAVLSTTPDPASTEIVQIYVAVGDAHAAERTGAAARAVLDAENPGAVTVEVSESVIELSRAVAGELGASSRALMVAILVGGCVITLVITSAMVGARRRHLGRMRALGASRSALVVIMLSAVSSAAILGVLAGAAVGTVTGIFSAGTVPPLSFVAGTCLLAWLAAFAGAGMPAVVASRRDPAAVLRVP